MTPWIVLATIVGYFILLFIISWAASRKSDTATALSGGRQAPWFIVAIAMLGAPISGVTFISVPGMVVTKGFSYLQMALGFIVGYFVIAYVLIPLFYKRNLVSIYGYLEQRFGGSTHKSGAWFFFISKSFCLILSVVLSIYFVAKGLGYDLGGLCKAVAGDDTSRVFFFDNPKEGTYFWKQFIAGIFMVIATTGLDQDLMQRSLACKNANESAKNLIVSVFLQVIVIALFLVLGTLLAMHVKANGIAMPEKTDELFGTVAFSEGMPVLLGVVFIIGLIAAAYSAAGSALTSLTTSFTVDILEADKKQDDKALGRTRRMVHIAMAAGMGLVILIFYAISNSDAISAVYTLASYTYGPILGLFAFGMMCKKPVRDALVPIVCIAAPILSWCIQWGLYKQFEYTLGFELLLLNAVLTMIGLALLIKGKK